MPVSAKIWRPSPSAAEDEHTFEVEGQDATLKIWGEDVLKTVEAELAHLDGELRQLNLDIHGHPELKFEEHYAHDALTRFMREHGFEVEEHFHLPTAWRATYSYGQGGRTLGVNSEMDALPGIGHACGHNLIATAGVAVALAAAKAIQVHDIPGKVVLLGTPAEEGGSGKELLLRAGAFGGMDVCVMCHPAPGPVNGASLSSCLAVERLVTEYHGATTHAALSPWEGRNAQDAAVTAYTSMSMLRQQVKPSHRIHGIIEGRDWAPNVIPDYAKLTIYSRAPSKAEVAELAPRVKSCCAAGALASGTDAKYTSPSPPTFDLRQNAALGNVFADIFRKHYGPIDRVFGISNASTDFGNVTYALPGLHPGFSIPTEPLGSNHTASFTRMAATPEAHAATIRIAGALAVTGVRVLKDDAFYVDVLKTFEEDKKKRDLLG
ncbi:unnamed protein product [Peniophora sp. CBMAI 1063]|nr:unnamed protein product [Peniophora sp. CBMAI 1063]